MVGIPKSNRCSFCKSRKTKCDEAWPTCSTCKRAKRECSGPPNFKFVVNGSHSTAASHNDVQSNGSPSSRCGSEDGLSVPGSSPGGNGMVITNDSPYGGVTGNELVWQTDAAAVTPSQRTTSLSTATSLNAKKRKGVRGPNSHRRMRLSHTHTKSTSAKPSTTPSPPPPPPPPPHASFSLSSHTPSATPADYVAAQLIYCLEAAPGTGNDLTLWGRSIPLIPPRLSESVALQHAAELVVASWTNAQRGAATRSAAHEWLDLRLYSRALRSLQDALENPGRGPATTTLTLAAQSLLQKVETTFDFSRGVWGSENHAAGLIAVIGAGGPRQALSELGLHLIFESFFSMFKHDVGCGRDSIFMNKTWNESLNEAIELTPMEPMQRQIYRFWVEMAVWPTLVNLTRHVQANPRDSMLAAELLMRATALLEYLGDLDSRVFAPARDSLITLIPNKTYHPDLLPTRLDFQSHELATFYTDHALFALMASRMAAEARILLGGPPTDDRGRTKPPPADNPGVVEFSSRIWMAAPSFLGSKPLGLGGVPHICAGYEAGGAAERALCVALLEDMEPYRRRPADLEAGMLSCALAATGRLAFSDESGVHVSNRDLES